ncbi:acetyltransferase [Pseudobacteriovorax antillogorgiicola]|uniref:Sugar O-acyltransferase, sialic acid O-acetyltransferase NeuD family n=1 Tax=Pseudobacteriovorax antillogorgiicola TaxID=1513793 RepID=A0A1Y6CMP9_9BACT|nr:acetyltransferase [Pseudobacteriovorax antillogorgiicola]TCS45191.1 sugar O-acyltransferase (sialic acid O-acetyltransferase NeuD family) [Pseudobacteriovorax antillogorgiicola]SMF75624.1 sugar O-acyltransferase, sialic acid O-acetyltransferase NeuD family [Pseudobacteriovorax antillogorgiicola]
MGSKYYIFGAGAHGRVVYHSLSRSLDDNERIFYADDSRSLIDRMISGVRVVSASNIGLDSLLHLALGNNMLRKTLADRFKDKKMLSVEDPSAVVSSCASIQEGCFIGPGSIVQVGAFLGRHVIVNTSSVIEHDVILEDYVNICPGVVTGGRVKIGSSSFIGPGCVLLGRVTIGCSSIIGGGAVVTRDVPEGVVAYGNPAKVVRYVTDEDWSRAL